MSKYDSSYLANGYVHARAILSYDHIQDLYEELPVVMFERRSAGLPVGVNIWLDSPAALRIATHPAILAIVTELLGEASLRIWRDQAFVRKSGSCSTPPHQDLPYWALKTTSAVTAWIPLTTCSSGGCMVYLPGTHKAGVFEPVGDIRRAEGLLVSEHGLLGTRQPEAPEVKTGDILFHHPLTVHYTNDVGLVSERRSYTVIYVTETAWKANGVAPCTQTYINALSPRVVLHDRLFHNGLDS